MTHSVGLVSEVILRFNLIGFAVMVWLHNLRMPSISFDVITTSCVTKLLSNCNLGVNFIKILAFFVRKGQNDSRGKISITFCFCLCRHGETLPLTSPRATLSQFLSKRCSLCFVGGGVEKIICQSLTKKKFFYPSFFRCSSFSVHADFRSGFLPNSKWWRHNTRHQTDFHFLS